MMNLVDRVAGQERRCRRFGAAGGEGVVVRGVGSFGRVWPVNLDFIDAWFGTVFGGQDGEPDEAGLDRIESLFVASGIDLEAAERVQVLPNIRELLADLFDAGVPLGDALRHICGLVGGDEWPI